VKVLFIVLGVACLSLGAVGIAVPGLPTTPFLLLAAALFVRSSDRLYRRLIQSRVLGGYIRRYREQGGMTLRAKILSMAIMWAMITVSLFTLRSTAVRVLVAAVGAVGTGVMGWVVKTVKAGRGDRGSGGEEPREEPREEPPTAQGAGA